MFRWINPFVFGYILVYVGNLWFASTLEGFPLEEAMGIMIVMGVGFSFLAHLLTRKVAPLAEPVAVQPREGWVLSLVIVYLALIIIPGNAPLTALLPSGWQDSAPEQEVITLVRKMVTMVAIPFLIYRLAFNFGPSDFGLSSDWKKALTGRHLIVFVGMACTLAVFNYFAGSGAKPLREGQLAASQLMIGIPLLFVWDLFEVGLGEEFAFRGLIQNRLAVLLRSPWGAVVVSALIFGIVHAPGMYLRGAGIVEGLGSEPSWVATISYCIAVQSVPGIFFGMIWMRTRNLWILMGIHAMTDLVPHLFGFINAWEI